MFGLGTGLRFASRNYEEYKERRRERIEEKHEEGIIEEVGSSSNSGARLFLQFRNKDKCQCQGRDQPTTESWELLLVLQVSSLQWEEDFSGANIAEELKRQGSSG